MLVDEQRFRSILARASLGTDGDWQERRYGNLVRQHFPGYEGFWRMFIVPATRRLETYPGRLGRDIGYRAGIDDKVQDLVEAHYTAFVHLVYAHRYLRAQRGAWVEDTAVHLASACELAETFFERTYLILLTCRGLQARVFQRLERAQFTECAARWYDEEYSDLYEHYLSKGKVRPIYFPSRKSLLAEFFGSYLDEKDAWETYHRHARTVARFRNRIVHNPKVGRLVTRHGQFLAPKPSAIDRYPAWRDVFMAALNPRIVDTDFERPRVQLESDLMQVEGNLDNLWKCVSDQFESEFYSPARANLRTMYRIEFGPASVSAPLMSSDHDAPGSEGGSASPKASTGYVRLSRFRATSASGSADAATEDDDEEGQLSSGPGDS